VGDEVALAVHLGLCRGAEADQFARRAAHGAGRRGDGEAFGAVEAIEEFNGFPLARIERGQERRDLLLGGSAGGAVDDALNGIGLGLARAGLCLGREAMRPLRGQRVEAAGRDDVVDVPAELGGDFDVIGGGRRGMR
jgi:hypothetical protein